MSLREEGNFLTTGCTCGPCINREHSDCKGSNCNCTDANHSPRQFLSPDTKSEFDNDSFME